MEELISLIESTASDVNSKMEYIYDDIKILRTRLQEAKENNDKQKLRKICEHGIIMLKKYYYEIEDIDENTWENVELSIALFLTPSGIGKVVSLTNSGVTILKTITDKIKQNIENVDYVQLNDKYFGNKKRVFNGNDMKEKSLKIITDNILLMEKIKKEIN